MKFQGRIKKFYNLRDNKLFERLFFLSAAEIAEETDEPGHHASAQSKQDRQEKIFRDGKEQNTQNQKNDQNNKGCPLDPADMFCADAPGLIQRAGEFRFVKFPERFIRHRQLLQLKS